MVFVHCNISYVQHIGSVAHAYAHAQTKALLPHRAIVRSSFLSIVFDGHMKSSTFFIFLLSPFVIHFSIGFQNQNDRILSKRGTFYPKQFGALSNYTNIHAQCTGNTPNIAHVNVCCMHACIVYHFFLLHMTVIS